MRCLGEARLDLSMSPIDAPDNLSVCESPKSPHLIGFFEHFLGRARSIGP